ncbi:MAG: DNA repair exonuclease [Candidatus Aenigmatarchaeota archaeon]|nr:DNA repair exonuclease [Nanoarchaeota archaeon]
MIISVISDTHLGFASGTERAEDSFQGFEQALEKSMDSDIILLAGDVFDTKVPTTEVMAKTMALLIKPLVKQNPTKIVDSLEKDMTHVLPITDRGIPVVALHGNHERRTRDSLNPVQALEKTGFLVHLNANGIILEKDGEMVCVQGLSAIPENYFESSLGEWDPKPKEGCFNILMLHQLFSPLTYSKLHVNMLPKGFDLYISGDLHEKKSIKHEGSTLLVPGSTVATQITKESVNRRGFWRIDTKGGTEFVELDSRPVHYLEDEIKSSDELDKKLSELVHGETKPVIRVNITDGFSESEIRKKYEDKAIIIFRKERQQTDTKNIEVHKLSVKETGRKILSDNIKEAGLNEKIFQEIFEILLENRVDDAINMLVKSDELNTRLNPSR